MQNRSQRKLSKTFFLQILHNYTELLSSTNILEQGLYYVASSYWNVKIVRTNPVAKQTQEMIFFSVNFTELLGITYFFRRNILEFCVYYVASSHWNVKILRKNCCFEANKSFPFTSGNILFDKLLSIWFNWTNKLHKQLGNLPGQFHRGFDKLHKQISSRSISKGIWQDLFRASVNLTAMLAWSDSPGGSCITKTEFPRMDKYSHWQSENSSDIPKRILNKFFFSFF